ncbi:MAG: glucokinase [Chitinophagaceae bacterium]
MPIHREDWPIPLYLPRLSTPESKDKIILAGDIGGTKTNLALYRSTGISATLIRDERFPSGDYTSFMDIYRKFSATDASLKPDAICLGVAGPVLNGKVTFTNLSWEIDSTALKNETGVNAVTLINDLEAFAYGLAALQPDDFITVHSGKKGSTGNMAILAPGTGLGEAGLFWDGNYFHPFPTEGGHCEFAPRNEEDIEVYRFLQKKYGIVSWERLIAGPAIMDLYYFVRDVLKMEEPAWLAAELQTTDNDSAVISEAALLKKAPACVKAMELFVRYMAQESASLVLKMKATGGLFLGGGIPPKIAPLLLDKSFMKHYLECDRMETLLKSAFIAIIKHDTTALLGTAYYGAYGKTN